MMHFETIDDSAMERVKGGLSFSLDLDVGTGLTVSGPLGSFTVPSPIAVAKEVFTTVAGKIGDLLQAVGSKLTQVGQLFDLS